jgi:methionyl-tRNA formyltransferase
VIKKLPGRWHFISKKEQLTVKKLVKLDPDYIFFLHWSWIVPEDIVDAYKCVNFHMTDLPYGRGGSPLQNLIVRGHTKTKVSAIRMTPELDAGPIYMKEPLSLEGTAGEILYRATVASAKMIGKIVKTNPQPKPQKGKVTIFRRRTPLQSEIPEGLNAKQLYDFIRMLDGEGYPPAYIEHDGFRYSFTKAVYNGSLTTDISITPLPSHERPRRRRSSR